MKSGMKHNGLRRFIACSNDDPRLALTVFYAKVKFGHLCFCMGKSKIVSH